MTDLSHFHGYPVKNVVMYGDDPHEWAIELEDGTQIRNYDGRRTALPEIPKGAGLLVAVLDKDETRLRFGFTPTAQKPNPPAPVEITLTPTSYSIAKGRLVKEVFPQQIDPEEREALAQAFTSSALRARQRHEELPPDPSAERAPEDDAESRSEATEDEDGTD